MIKNLTVVLALSVFLTACGGSDNKGSKSSSSKSSIMLVSSAAAVSSVASSVAVSSAASSAVESSVASSSSSSGVCSQNPDSNALPCDKAEWTKDGDNGGTFDQGESGVIFNFEKPTGTQSYHTSGFYHLVNSPEDAPNSVNALGKTLTVTFIVDDAFVATGAPLQIFIQKNYDPYDGTWCNIDKTDETDEANPKYPTGVEIVAECPVDGDKGPGDGVPSIRLGVQVGDPKPTVYAGSLEITDATFE